MQLIFKELKEGLLPLLIFFIFFIVLNYSGMYEYSGVDNAGGEIWENISPIILAVFSMSEFDLSTAYGYYGTIYQYLLICGAFYFIVISINPFVNEEKDKTAEFLYTRPISRKKIFLYKGIVILIKIIIFTLLSLVSSLLIVPLFVKNLDLLIPILRVHLIMFLLGICFASIGCLCSSIAKNAKAAINTGVMIVGFAYFVGIFIDIIEEINDNQESLLRVITPLKYFKISTLLESGSINGLNIILMIVISMIFLYFSYDIYLKKDLKN